MDDIYISKSKKSSKQSFPVEIPEDEFQLGGEPGGGKRGKKRKEKKARKKHRILKAIISLALIAFILSSALITTLALASGYSRGTLESNSYVSSSSLASSPLVTNILLIGVDGSVGSSRSDSMILVSIDMLHFKIKLTSFLRDSWVEIPSRGSYAKLNAACTYGGAQLVVDTIEYNFGVDIAHYVLVDFDMFTQIIDKLGGVDVEVTSSESSFINRTTSCTVPAGDSVHLGGREALVYCRIRKLDSDRMRTYRQRKVISAIVKQARFAGPAKLIDTATDVFPLIETDMNALEITALAQKGIAAMLLYDIEQSRVPQDSDSSGAVKSGQDVVELDLDASRQYLYDFIYTSKIDPEES